MFCPKCGTENPDNARLCQSCSWDLTNISTNAQRSPSTRTLAILSLVLSISSIALLILLAAINKLLGIVGIVLVGPQTAIIALVLGAISLIKTKKGRSSAIAGVIISALWLVVLVGTYFVYTHPHIRRVPGRLVRQRVQLHILDAAIELFASELKGYPPSDAMDKDKKPYCGAMKLCEALMGQDLMGFHPKSRFSRDGMDGDGNLLYVPATVNNRRGPYLPIENANAYCLKDIYKNVGPFDRNSYIICDTCTKQRHAGKKTGMPILYYKADTLKTAHNLDNPDDSNNIYNYKDNYAILSLGIPEDPNKKHPLFTNPKIFYEMTKNYSITTQSRPCRADSYILISAGLDGLYGTKDDVANFQIQWKPK